MGNRALVQKLGYRTNQNTQESELKLEQRTGHPSNLSTDIASYPLGVFTASEKGGKIVFAASTLFLQDNDGPAPCSAGASTLYLSADDYKASDFYKEQQTEGGDEGTEEGGDSDAGSEE